MKSWAPVLTATVCFSLAANAQEQTGQPSPANAQAVFDLLFAQDCIGDPSDDAFDAGAETFELTMQGGADSAPPETVRIFRLLCNRGAYNVSHIHLMGIVGQAGVKPVAFAVPSLEFEAVDGEEIVTFSQNGFTTRFELVNSDLDVDTGMLTSWEKWRGVGDASETGTWMFWDGTFSLVSYEVDATYDGEINPVAIFHADDRP